MLPFNMISFLPRRLQQHEMFFFVVFIVEMESWVRNGILYIENDTTSVKMKRAFMINIICLFVFEKNRGDGMSDQPKTEEFQSSLKIFEGNANICIFFS